MYPDVSEVNCTPRFTEVPSPASGTVGEALPKILHGQVGAAVVGVDGLEGADAGPVPAALVALTANV